MDLYTLDSNFYRKEVIDTFQSLIWTERYNAAGDVTLVVPDVYSITSLLVEGTYLGIPESNDVMLIDTVNSDSGLCTLTGQSLTAFLTQRMLRNTWSTAATTWNLLGSAGSIAGQIVTAMCISGGTMDGTTVVLLGTNEVISHLSLGTTATGTSISVAVPYGNVYDGIKAVCDLDAIGFRMYPTNFTGGGAYDLKFSTYRGLDRTTDQSTNGVVIFESATDSFANVKGLRSLAGYKNVAYAWANGLTAQNQMGIAYASGGSASRNFARRTLMVDASDVNVADYATTPLLVAVLNQRAANALANNNYVRMFDGQIVPQNPFIYGADYNLGDIIELRDTTNVSQQARITEYIRAQDSTGEQAYPTLSVLS